MSHASKFFTMLLRQSEADTVIFSSKVLHLNTCNSSENVFQPCQHFSKPHCYRGELVQGSSRDNYSGDRPEGSIL